MKYNAMKAFLPVVFAFVLLSQSEPALAEQRTAASIPAAALVQPADLASNLKNASTPKPLMLHVGFRLLYTQAHIPGSEYAGPASEETGLQLLRNRVAKLPRNTPIVIYCGCCPWSDCPNMAAAYDALHALGFTQVKALYIANNFGTNWIDRGYPVAKGG
jgi:3-mercaptopyruvate sulfurtransferase SseA